MKRSIMGVAVLFLCFACGDGKSEDNDNNQDSESGSEESQPSDTTAESDAGADDTVNDGSESGGDLWASAWSILGTRCGAANACHNRASGGSGGINLPASDEAATKANAEAEKNGIRSEVASGGMPQGDTLTEAERLMVTDWIDPL